MTIQHDDPSRMVGTYNGLFPNIAESAFVARGAVVTGDTVIGEETSIWFGCVLRGDVGHIRIGKRTNIQDLTMIHVTGAIGAHAIIGDEVTVGHRAVIHGATVEDRCLIGMGAVILDHAVIGEGSVVGAGAVVTPRTKIPPGSLVFGSPGKVVRPVREGDAMIIAASAQTYCELARQYREQGWAQHTVAPSGLKVATT